MSTGWWVGPSSPSPMASCVKTKMVGTPSGPRAGCRPRIIAKDEKGSTKGSELGEGESVNDGSHGVFVDPEMEILPLWATGLDIFGTLINQDGLVGWSEISRPPEEPLNFAPGRSAPCPKPRARQCPGGSAGNTGRFRSHPGGSSWRCIWSTSAASSGYLPR